MDESLCRFMVAKIKSGKSLIGGLNYNENKVRNDKAQLIEASGYFKDLADLSFHDKLFRLTDLAAGNERTGINCLLFRHEVVNDYEMFNHVIYIWFLLNKRLF